MAGRLHFIILFLVAHVYTSYGSDIIKGSLTFVIDDTGSMWDEIDQVKDEANEIFETVLRSNASQIENFILVTFNDPDAELRVVTKDRNEFKRALAAINVNGGDDCPEYAMTGIEQALAESLPLSYLFVFTDASAKDHNMYEKIKGICQKKQSQVFFVLTGICGTKRDDDYKVYHQIANATNGQVFHTDKHEVKDVLAYVKEVIKSRGTVVGSKHFPPGYNNTMDYLVDGDTGDVLIVVTGDKPKIGTVTGPEGSKPKTETIMEKDQTAIVKATGAKPGMHSVEVGSKSETHAVITAKTSINFQLGFSVFKPTSIKDTVSRPPPDGKAFLSIKLLGDQAVLNTAKILDMGDNVIAELPLELIDSEEKLYRTALFNPPYTMFRISVSGYDERSKSPITRTSPTPIERQNLKTETISNVSPQINIDGAPKITTEYGDPIEIVCKVHAYPKPDIIWEEKDTRISLPATVSLLEVPYDYISILKIEKAENKTYQCKGSNSFGSNTNSIEVETKITTYFNIIEAPKPDINITYNKEGSIICKVDAKPPATITWLKEGNVITPDKDITMSGDTSTLTIKHMQPETAGTYVCEARNEKHRKVFFSKVNVLGLEKPTISEDYDELIEVNEGDDLQLFCRISGGKPKPTVNWQFASDYGEGEYSNIRYPLHTEELEFKNITKKQGGDYECVATNVAGSARKTTYVMVNFPPVINDKITTIKAVDGGEVIVPCDADGTPTPEVTWYKNGVQIMGKRDPASAYGLRFRATIADSGDYTCKASSKLGSANKTVSVNIVAPVTIDIPKVSKIQSMVGKTVILPCRADGHPRPRTTWTFHSSDTKIPPKDVTPLDESRSDLQLRNIQLNQQGFYTCVARNDIGKPASIQYEVIVNAPPIIENVYMDKTFEVVEGDLVLRIQCKATGSPKPFIIWKKDGLNIAFGSEWYDMEEDGTLIIKNIDDKSRGSYVCLAQNAFGKDTEMFEVVVNKYPKLSRPTSTISLNVGESIDLKCDIPHTKTDLLRWYKDGVLKTTGELRLENVKLGDDGLYTCRVSDFTKARSVHTKVQIGHKPKFISTEIEEIEFSVGTLVILICDAIGQPTPKVSWKHNGKQLDVTEMVHVMELNMDDRGIFECEVSNDLGTISRSFRIQSKDCILDIKKDFTGNHPMMLSNLLKQPSFEIVDGYMIIPNTEYFVLNCPSKFANFASKPIVTAFCEGESKVKIKGKTYAFRDIQCREKVEPEELRTGIACLPGNTESIKIGFKVFGDFHEVYQVCLDKDKNVPVFTKQKLHSDFADSSQVTEWFNTDLLPFDFDRMYDCRHQTVDIGSTFGRDVTSHASCCFGKRQLVNSHDLPPGIPVTAAFSNLNVIPHWSTCNSKNWNDVEVRVRKLAKSAGRDLLVSTGTARPLLKPRSANVSLYDGRGGQQPVAEYLWKIVQDPPSSASLAIIQVNIPGLSKKEAMRHVLCNDICKFTEWMKNENWYKVDDGFTYCCTISTFERAFGYDRRFSPGMNKVLFDASLIPENYMTI